jgi:hypothetical protein
MCHKLNDADLNLSLWKPLILYVLGCVFYIEFHLFLPDACLTHSHFWRTVQLEFQQVMEPPSIQSWRMNWTVQIDSFWMTHSSNKITLWGRKMNSWIWLVIQLGRSRLCPDRLEVNWMNRLCKYPPALQTFSRSAHVSSAPAGWYCVFLLFWYLKVQHWYHISLPFYRFMSHWNFTLTMFVLGC